MLQADFHALAFYEKRWVQAVAAGQAARKAALAGRSAARVLGMWLVTTDSNEPVELLLPNGRTPSRRQWPDNTVYHRARNCETVIKHFDTLRVTDELTLSLIHI
mgnify:FL=1